MSASRSMRRARQLEIEPVFPALPAAEASIDEYAAYITGQTINVDGGLIMS